jgi:hypothetical protein
VNMIVMFFRKLYHRFIGIPKFKVDFLKFINKCNKGKDVTVEYCMMIIFLCKIQDCLPNIEYTSYLLTIQGMYQNTEEINNLGEMDRSFLRKELEGIF